MARTMVTRRARRYMCIVLLLACSALEVLAQVKPDEDFVGYMENVQAKESEQARARQMLDEHEVGSLVLRRILF